MSDPVVRLGGLPLCRREGVVVYEPPVAALVGRMKVWLRIDAVVMLHLVKYASPRPGEEPDHYAVKATLKGGQSIELSVRVERDRAQAELEECARQLWDRELPT